jgi:hypothetical protein
MRLLVYKDGGSNTASSWYNLASGWHTLEVQFNATGATGANDGAASLWLDGVQKQALTGIDNDTMAIDSVRLGVSGIDTGTRGSIYYDDFDSRRFSAIGLLPDPGVHNPTPAPQPEWSNVAYTYGSAEHVHAVTALSNGAAYTYDANGNIDCRAEDGKTYVQSYNLENRMSAVLLVSGTCTENGTILAGWAFTYDGDGNRVKQVYTDGTSTLTSYYFAGESYEVQVKGEETVTKVYYAFGGQTVAMRTIIESSTTLVYFLTDHLGSVVAVLDADGAVLSQQRYLPFGQVRTDVGGSSPQASYTDLGYTFQRDLDAQGAAFSIGLMDYKARFYDHYPLHPA